MSRSSNEPHPLVNIAICALFMVAGVIVGNRMVTDHQRVSGDLQRCEARAIKVRQTCDAELLDCHHEIDLLKEGVGVIFDNAEAVAAENRAAVLCLPPALDLERCVEEDRCCCLGPRSDEDEDTEHSRDLENP